jgi:hypothetical protein
VNSVLEIAGFFSLGCLVSHWSKEYKKLREELRVLKEEQEAGEGRRLTSN